MNVHTQDYLQGFEAPDFKYATFWQRVWASIIDGLILSPVFFLIYFNNTNWKNLPLIIALNLISLIYKPLLEYKFGATVGKMVVKLSILNYDYQKIGLNNSLFRNVFYIVPGIISLILALLIYQVPAYQTSSSIDEYEKVSNTFINTTWYSVITTLIYIIDIVFIFSDSKKRTLHDRIGETIVVQKKRYGS